VNEWVLLVIVGLPLIAVWISTVVEVIGRQDLRIGRTLVWLAVLVLVPVLGLAVYVVARPPRRPARSATAAPSTEAEQLVLLAERRQRDELTDDEFRAAVGRLGSP
jgi:hypothetical protein